MPFFSLLLSISHAQPLDPDKNPYFTRYTIVEDSDQLTPLAGKYVVHFIQLGTYRTVTYPEEAILGLPEKSLRLQPMFGAGYPMFLATPARGTDPPDAKLVVLRGQDTKIVEIMAYYPGMGEVAIERVEGHTVQVRITGRLMLDGGCTSSMPLFAVEPLTDTGRVLRSPMHDR